MTVSLALFDYVPVCMFLITSIILQRCFYNKMSKGAFAVFSCGTIMVFIGGFYKATWKLLYCAGICDFTKLSEGFLPIQGTGFLLAAVALIAMMVHRQETKNEPLYAVAAAPAVYSGTMIFIAMNCTGIIIIGTILSIVAKKMGRKGAIPFFVLAVIGMMMMGYLSSKDFTQPVFNWIAEAVNTCAQGCLMIGAIKLKKAGLAEFRLTK